MGREHFLGNKYSWHYLILLANYRLYSFLIISSSLLFPSLFLSCHILSYPILSYLISSHLIYLTLPSFLTSIFKMYNHSFFVRILLYSVSFHFLLYHSKSSIFTYFIFVMWVCNTCWLCSCDRSMNIKEERNRLPKSYTLQWCIKCFRLRWFPLSFIILGFGCLSR